MPEDFGVEVRINLRLVVTIVIPSVSTIVSLTVARRLIKILQFVSASLDSFDTYTAAYAKEWADINPE